MSQTGERGIEFLPFSRSKRKFLLMLDNHSPMVDGEFRGCFQEILHRFSWWRDRVYSRPRRETLSSRGSANSAWEDEPPTISSGVGRRPSAWARRPAAR